MGFLDKVLIAGGAAIAGALARSIVGDALETQRRRSSPLSFDDGVSREEFAAIAQDAARRAPRVSRVDVAGMTATLHVRSNSGLTTWTAQVDFNDYGHLTGAYWITTENDESLIPEHFARAVRAEIEKRSSRIPNQGG